MRKVYFRADAGGDIGYGHFIRSLALADMLKDNFDCTFFTVNPSEYQIRELNNVCNLQVLDEDTKFDSFINFLRGDEIVVLDNYFYSTEYQIKIKNKGCKLVCIDDMHDKHYVSDVVINHGLTDKRLFDCEAYTKLCLGFEHALLREPFLKDNPKIKRNNNLVLNFGGADPYGLTDRFISLLCQIEHSYNIVVILGDRVNISDTNISKVNVLRNLSALEMANLFDISAAAILSASTVCIEALSRNIPIIAGYHVDNQVEFYHSLVHFDSIVPVGLLQDMNSSKLETALTRIVKCDKMVFPQNIKERYINIFKSL